MNNHPHSTDLIHRLRALEADHAPDGYPPVQMRDITDLLDLNAELLTALKAVLKANRATAIPPQTVQQAHDQLDQIVRAGRMAEAAIAKAEGGAA